MANYAKYNYRILSATDMLQVNYKRKFPILKNRTSKSIRIHYKFD